MKTFQRALWRTVRYRATEVLGLTRPSKLRFVATKRCNSRCVMCSAWQSPNSSVPEITAEEIQKIASVNRWFLRCLTHITFTGGEPTLRLDLVELVQTAHQSFPGTLITINTNGFNSERVLSVITEVLKFHPQLAVMVSLDGLGKIHERIRRVPKVFLRVAETIDNLIELRKENKQFRVEVNFVLTNYNNDQLLPVFHFCRERGIEFNPIYPTYGQLYGNDDVEVGLDCVAVKCFLSNLAEVQKNSDSLLYSELRHLLDGFGRDFDCWAGRVLFFIDSDCRVFPNVGCPSSFWLGNLREFGYSFRQMLQSGQAQRIRQRLRRCRLCRLPCETMTTLKGPEALTGYYRQRGCHPHLLELKALASLPLAPFFLLTDLFREREDFLSLSDPG